MSSEQAVAEVSNLSLSYRQDAGWRRVLHDVSFAIHRGEVFGLVGESGSGKSTLAYQLLSNRQTNLRIDHGRVLFKEFALLGLDRPALNRLRGNRIGLVPQNPTTALSPSMRIGRQVGEVLQLHQAGRSQADIRARVTELFGLVGLPDPAGSGRRYPHELSGGQRQRVCIAMALACEPDLVVLDEPTTGLDVTTQDQIVALLASLRARTGTSMLYVTHDLGLLAQIADRVGVMYAGQLVEIAAAKDLFSNPRHPYTRGLIASIPRIDDATLTIGEPLRGMLRRDDLPVGCAFAPRCDFREPSCATNHQKLEEAAPTHKVACQRWPALPAPATRKAAESRDGRLEQAAMPVLRLAAIAIDYRRRYGISRLLAPAAPAVVSDVTFTIDAGETFAIVGESGSGKSTLARAVSGLIAPSRGTIDFRGVRLPVSIADRPVELRRQIQYIFQNPDASLNPRARIGAILSQPLKAFFELDRSEIDRRIERALVDVRLDVGYARRFPDELSGGERQRVAIARALVAKPELLLCDEILSALDVSVQANVLTLLKDLQREHRVGMLFISHDLAVVRHLADTVGVLFRGRLMQIGTARSVFLPPFHPYTHELLMAVPRPQQVRRDPEPRPRPVQPVADPDKGCPFAGRCAWQVGSICLEVPPPWRTTEDGKRIRCHIELSDLSAHATYPGHAAVEPNPGPPADLQPNEPHRDRKNDPVVHPLTEGEY